MDPRPRGLVSALARFQIMCRLAEEGGVFNQFRAKYQTLRATGMDPLQAAEEALTEATGSTRAALAVTLAGKEGKA